MKNEEVSSHHSLLHFPFFILTLERNCVNQKFIPRNIARSPSCRLIFSTSDDTSPSISSYRCSGGGTHSGGSSPGRPPTTTPGSGQIHRPSIIP